MTIKILFGMRGFGLQIAGGIACSFESSQRRNVRETESENTANDLSVSKSSQMGLSSSTVSVLPTPLTHGAAGLTYGGPLKLISRK